MESNTQTSLQTFWCTSFLIFRVYRSWWNGRSDRSLLPYCDVHPNEMDFRKRWLDGGRSECNLTKRLEKSCMWHQREVCSFIETSSNEIDKKKVKERKWVHNKHAFRKCMNFHLMPILCSQADTANKWATSHWIC